MGWLQTLDVGVFRFINRTLSNPVLDWMLPFFSWNAFFLPSLVVVVAVLLWKGGARGRLFVLGLALVTIVGDGLITHTLKEVIGRPRPFLTLPDVHVLIGRGASGSMPSGHSANWFAAAAVAFIYYRRSLWLMLPLAATIGFARVYLGVHYPGDVLAGALLGASYAFAILWSLNALWGFAGKRWFPLWWSRLPSILDPAGVPKKDAGAIAKATEESLDTEMNRHWLRLSYLLIGILLLIRLIYLASGVIELSEDEAYQWVWSKHPALSYYSKPPLIAYTQLVGTTLWGDTAFGVRFFSPVLGALLSLLLVRFLAKEVNARAGFWLLVMTTTTPLLAVGTILMTIDPLSVFFWTAAMISGWRAVRGESIRLWLWTGLWTGLGFLSKYVALFQLVSWAVFFLLWKPARSQWRRPGPYLALLVMAVCTLPVLIWNYQNGWITVIHLADRGGLSEVWRPSLRFFWDFVLAETALLNPFFLAATVWAVCGAWRQRTRSGFALYLFAMGVPLFLFYFLYTFRARVQPNWIVPSVLPLFCLAVVYWEARWREKANLIRRWLALGVTFGAIVVVVLHETNLIQKVTGIPLPAALNPFTRVRGSSDLSGVIGAARAELLREGKPVFIIGDHYGLTGLISFYLPEAKRGVPGNPLVYYQSSRHPENQFYFWPGYEQRTGQNAIYVQQCKMPRPPPERITKEFGSVTDLGMREVRYRGQVFHRVQLFACRDLK